MVYKRGLAHITPDYQRHNSCTIPRSLGTALGWQAGERVLVRFGCARRTVRLVLGDEDEWHLSAEVSKALRLTTRRLGYQLDGERRLMRLGPLIGLMTTFRPTPFFRSVMKIAAARGMVVYTFNPRELDIGRRQVMAWVYIRGTLRRTRMPWPDVVYNRLANRGLEMAAATRLTKRIMKARGITVFNPTFFHKWRIHRLLRPDPEARAYLPATHRLTSFSQVASVLRRYGMVYLKPNGGSKGHGIVKVAIRRDRRIQVSYRHHHQNYDLTSASWSEAESLIRGAMHRRSYIVQEGLRLARYKGRPFDVRVTLYKNAQGEWLPMGPTAKIAGKGSITTHVANGGRVIHLDRALQHAFGEQAEDVRRRLYKAAVTIAIAVERVTRQQLGELGLDIGISSDGRVALFEANSKPGRAVFSPGWNRSSRRESIQHLCDYAARVAGFRARGEDDA